MKRVLYGVLAFAATAALVTGGAGAQEVTLRAVSAFQEGTYFARPFERFIERVNERGRGQVRINFVGGPRAVPPFEVGNAVRNGVIDVASVPGAFYANLLPEAAGFSLTTLSMAEMRRNGAWQFLNELHNQRVNAYYLGRNFINVPYHFYFRTRPERINQLDFTGLRIRVSPVYRALVEALGGTALTTPPGEVFTALERGVVDGYGWPAVGIFDLGWERVTRVRLDPAFYSGDVSVLVNLPAWNRLNEAQRAVLNEAVLWLEALDSENETNMAAERQRQAQAGIETVTLPPEAARRLQERAAETGWAVLIQQNPQTGPRMRQLTTR